MFTTEDEQELERQADDASSALLLLLFVGRPGVRSNRKVVFNPKRGGFLVDGKLVSITTIRVLLAQIEKIGAKRMQTHLDDFLAGRITLAEWQRRSRQSIRISHILASALALGGIDRAAQDPATEQRIAEENRYITGFASDLKAGKLSAPKAASRAKSYMLAVAVTYWLIDQNLKRNLVEIKDIKKPIGGKITLTEKKLKQLYTEAKRYRRASESCPGCIEYAGRWIPIDQMPAIGSLECRSRCRCFIVYR